jgi:thioredoxin 1
MIEVREIKSCDDFKSFIEMREENLHIIKLGAEWCGPCRQLSGFIKNLDETKTNSTLFAEVDIEEDGLDEIISEYKVRSIPVTLFIKNNELLEKKVGLINTVDLYNMIEQYK